MKKILLVAAATVILMILLHDGKVRAENYSIYWGDIHSHTAYSDDAYVIQKNLGLEPGRVQSALDYGKQQLDFLAIKDHAEHTEYYRDQNGNLIGCITGSPFTRNRQPDSPGTVSLMCREQPTSARGRRPFLLNIGNRERL